MRKKKLKNQRGFTMVELIITIIIAAMVLFSVGMVMSDSQKAWTRMHNMVFSETATDGYVVRQAFDAVIRKASREKIAIDSAGSWIEIYCYQDEKSTEIDHYVRIFETGGKIKVEHGVLNPRAELSTRTICENVSNCVFKQMGRSAQMILTLDDGSVAQTVVSSAFFNN